jgi:aldose 1-epimerase
LHRRDDPAYGAAVADHEVVAEQVDGLAGVVLASKAHELRAGFAPDAGMVGYSLTHRGDQLLGLRGGLPAYVERGSSFGIPILHPWANRLSGMRYTAGGREVRLEPERSPLHLDANGLPIHGLLAASPHWSLVGRTPGNGLAGIAARLDLGAHEELLAAFPFPHELHLQVELRGGTLSVTTILLPTGDAAVPVAFGWHPYLRLPDVARSDWGIELPVRGRAVLDERGIPTGKTEPAEAQAGPLGDRAYDDLFPELDTPRVFTLEGGGRRIELELGDGYPVAQVYAPAGQELICFEPMTAPTDALVSGRGLQLVSPGDSFRAVFEIRVLS